jgi:hypothetical protein
MELREMSYVCPNCGRYVADATYHACTGNGMNTINVDWDKLSTWKYETNYVYRNDDYRPKCANDKCIYSERALFGTKTGMCTNKSVVIDEDGKCKSFVKRDD